MKIMFLGLGASSLSIIKIPYNISLIMTLLCIPIVGYANKWSYNMILDIYEEKMENKKDINNYKDILFKYEYKFKYKYIGPIIKFVSHIILILYSVGEIIIHQILIYRTIGGIINILGGYMYIYTSQFLSESFLGKTGWKILINYTILILIIIPSNLLYINNIDKKTDLSSVIGFFIIIFIVLSIIVESIFYLILFVNEEGHNWVDINFYHVEKGFTKKLYFFQSLGILFFCFSGHSGLIQIIKNIESDDDIERKLEHERIYIYSNLFNSLIYLCISIFGYFSMPIDVVDIITERKIIWSNDIIMTIIRFLIIPISINKIQINCNILKDTNNYNNYIKYLIILLLFVTTLISSFYQNIVFYITFIGGLISFPAFFIPPIMYNHYYEPNKCRFKVIIRYIIGSVLLIVGFISSIMALIDLKK